MLRDRIFYWCQNTAGQPFETGIQRVVRRLATAFSAIGVEVVSIGWDDRSRNVRLLGPRGHLQHFDNVAAEAPGTPFFVPELAMDLVAVDVDPIQVGRAYGLRTHVIVHDLIPLKLRDHYDPGVVRMYARFYDTLAFADGLITTTRYVAGDLRHHFQAAGLPTPPIHIVPLPAQFAEVDRVSADRPARRVGDPLRLVSVVTWEPRKNVAGLLRALAKAQAATDVPIQLDLVGRRACFPAYDAEVLVALAATAGVRVHGTMSDQALAALVAGCDASVYPSWEEGFGLPIGESLWLGTPCLCHNASSMAEIAPGGGTMMIDMTDEDALTSALVSFATEPQVLRRLASEIAGRPLTGWTDCARGVARALAMEGDRVHP